MRQVSLLLTAATVLVAGSVASRVEAQIVSRYSTTSPTTDQLLERLVALEARVAKLESLLSVVNGQVVLGSKVVPVLLLGSSITIQPDGMLKLLAGSSMTIGTSASLSLQATGPLAVESGQNLDIRGRTILLNNGLKPVSCMGATTNPVIGTEKSHFHQVTGQGCGTTVLVP